jgi:hypothetical protein
MISRYNFWLLLFKKIILENTIRNVANFILLIIGIEFMVLTFFYRWIFSVLLVLYSIYLFFSLKCDSSQVINSLFINYEKFQKLIIILYLKDQYEIDHYFWFNMPFCVSNTSCYSRIHSFISSVWYFFCKDLNLSKKFSFRNSAVLFKATWPLLLR